MNRYSRENRDLVVLKYRAAAFYCLAAASLLLAARSVGAQTRDLAAVKGQVLDAQGMALASANVTLTNTDSGAVMETKTDAQGNYSFQGIALTGHYSIKAAEAGFSASEKAGLQFKAGETATVEFKLNVAAGSEQVVVLGTTEGVQADSAEVSDRLDGIKIESTPILNNKLTSLALLDSSVRPSQTTGDVFTNETLVVVNGGGRRQTTFSIDNTNADDSWGRQTIITTLPLTSVQEFTVLTNSVSAEYGRNAGAAVNVVTKSGTNNFHGDFLGMGRPAWSEASAPLATTKAENTLAEGSGTFGGPIVHDRTYFLLGAEFNDQNRDAVITSPVSPGSIFTGNFRQELFLARLDHKLTDSNKLTFRANLDRFYDTNPQDGVSGNNLPSTARTFVKHTYAAALSDDWTLSPNLLNEARLQWQLASPVTQFIPQFPQPQVSLSGFYTVGDSRFADLQNHQYEQADTLIWVRRRHTLHFGVDLNESSSGGFGQEFGSGFLDGQWTINNPGGCNYSSIPLASVLADLAANPSGAPAQAVCSGAPPPLVASYSQTFGGFTYNVKELLWGTFVQDDWKLRPGLTLNLGLRYEGQTYLHDDNNVAPRFGLAWLLPHTRTTVVRASYGVYYSEIRADLAAGYALGGPTGLFTFSATPGKCGYPATFGPWPSLSALLNSPACTAPGGAATVPLRDITVGLGQTAFLNQFLSVAGLHFYPSHLLNPYTQQWTLGAEHELAKGWILSADYVGSHSVKLERPDDLNAPAVFVRTVQGQTRSVAAANATRPVQPSGACTTTSANFNLTSGNCFNNYRQILAIVNLGSGYYDGLDLKLNKHFSNHFSMLLTYTYSHAIDTVEPDAANQNANDWNLLGPDEKATSILDQRHRAALSGWYDMPWGFTTGANATLGSGFPFLVTTGTDNNGDGTTADRPVINGAVIPRNFGSGTPIYDFGLFLQKSIRITEHLHTELRAEAFNVLNHSNFYSRNGTFGNNATPPASFGTPIGGIANTGPGRQMQFSMRFAF
ncbi:MAG TPA: TonB-dependent receptor [Candidatus Acidoferrales bacterium]|nr:TonB-dependent receptor [Candidatus Acidoferrales bacterium]